MPIDYNPISLPCCSNCPHYVPKARYVSELDSDKASRRCKNLPICGRVARLSSRESKEE